MTLPFYTPNAQWLVPASQPLALLQGIQALVTLIGSGNRLGGGGGKKKRVKKAQKGGGRGPPPHTPREGVAFYL